MKLRDLKLGEAFHSAFHATGFRKKPTYTELYRNPDRSELLSLIKRAKYKNLRGHILQNKDLIVWDANHATHGDVGENDKDIEHNNVGVWLILFSNHIEMNDIHLYRDGEENDRYLRSKVRLVQRNPHIRALYGNRPKIIGLDNDRDIQEILSETRHHWDSPEFRSWFRHSIVRDRNGNPARVYHASHVRDAFGDFDTFDRQAVMKHLNRKEGADTVGSWFSDRPDQHGAGMYVGDSGTIYPVYLRIENPWRPQSFDEFLNVYHRTAGRKPSEQNPRGQGSAHQFRTWLTKNGHDGIMFGPEVGIDQFRDAPAQRVWVALEPQQIKSAVGNRGTYGWENPEITK